MGQCPNCGASLKPGTLRCAKCGTQFAPPEPQVQPQYQQPAAPFPPQGYPQQPFYGNQPGYAPQAPIVQGGYPQQTPFVQAGYPQQSPVVQHVYVTGQGGPAKSKVAAGVLALFFGVLGMHNFYLGRNGIAICQLLISVVTCGWGALFVSLPWSFIEAIMIFTGSLRDGQGRSLQ